MSPLCPPPGFPPHLTVIWPLIWAQILVLRAMVRAAYGKGTPYRWSVTPWGRAFIVSINPQPGQKLAVLTPPAYSNDRVVAALDGRAFTPAYVRNPFVSAHPGEDRNPAAHTALSFGPSRSVRLSWNVPVPDS